MNKPPVTKEGENYCVICDGGFRVIKHGTKEPHVLTEERCKKCHRVMYVEQ